MAGRASTSAFAAQDLRTAPRHGIIAAMRPHPVIVIVGAGFCGVTAASLLLKSALPDGTRIVLLERPGHGIGGVAYDLPSERLLLNVRAERMSAFVDAPGDFVDFLAAAEPTATPHTFVSRCVYGRYLAARLDAAAFGGGARVLLEPKALEVLDVRRGADGRWEVLADAGVKRMNFSADVVLLATGGSVPQPPRWLAPWMIEESRYAEAWSPSALPSTETSTVVAIGTGLTFVDLVIALRAGGFAGRIVAVSRHGRLPRAERGPLLLPDAGDLPEEITGRGPLSVRQLTRAIARHTASLGARGRDYRQLLAALRPHSARLWADFSATDRARFLRHARAIWDVHRHRMPESSARIIETEIANGVLEIVAGRVLDVGRSATGLTLAVQRRGCSDTEAVHAGHIVNCTGAPPGAPLGNPWPALIERGTARRDALGLGVLTDREGRVLDDRGAPTAGLHYAGPLWRAQEWEMTSVPELRGRVPEVVAAIVASVVRGPVLA